MHYTISRGKIHFCMTIGIKAHNLHSLSCLRLNGGLIFKRKTMY